MASPSASQESDSEYVTWRARGAPPISIRRNVMLGIQQEVRRGETGGVLLGHREDERIVVEDFEPLSAADSDQLRETLDWFRSGAQPGISVLGFYRSNTGDALVLRPEDEELVRRHFEEGEDLLLLIKPSRRVPTLADFFIRRAGKIEEADAPQPFPFLETAGECDSAPPRVISWPAPRPRLAPETQSRTARRWLWYAAAAILGIAGGALGFLWLRPAAPRPVPAATQPAPPPAPSAVPPSGEEPETAWTPDITGVRALLDRWSAALKRNDLASAAACYAPVVATYFARHNVPRDAVLRGMRQSLTHYGGLEIYRLSDVKISQVAEDRAVASFRKHWQTTGRRKSAGEEQERMTFVRDQGRWQISSEQQERIYWSHKSR